MSTSSTLPTGAVWAIPYVFGRAATGLPYPPHPTQAKVFDWALERLGQTTGGIPVLYLQHGVRSGGTRAVLNILLARLTQEPGLRVLIGRKDFNDLRLSIMETFFDIVPKDWIVEQDSQEHRYVLRAGKTGTSTVFFRGLKDLRGLGSQEFGCISVHEAHEVELATYRTLKQRCNQGQYPPMLLLEGNPPHEGHWLTQLADPISTEFDPDLTFLKMPTYENWPHLSESYKTSLESMPPAWRKRYLLGDVGPLPAGTPVYPAYVESVHARETSLIPDRPLIRGWDFGLRRAACIWGQRADNGQILWHREWLAVETPEDQFIEGVQVRTQEWFGDRVCQDFGDPAATQRDPQGVSTLQRLQQHGITLRYRPTTYGERIPLINQKLSAMIQGRPQLVINPLCQVLREGLGGGYHYPDLAEGREFGAKKDIPFKDGWFDHVLNAFEYAMVGLFLAANPRIEQFRKQVHQREHRFQRRQGAVVF